MIYSHKPQRSGRSIASNTNNPPQDPPPPHEEKQITIQNGVQPEIVQTIPDIPIEDTTPPVPEVCTKDKLTLPKVTLIKEHIPETKPKVTITPEIKVKQLEPKISWFKRFINRVKGFFRR